MNIKAIADMHFWAAATSGGKFVGRVQEFPDLKTKPFTSRLDAVSDIVTLAAQRIRDIHESQAKAAGA